MSNVITIPYKPRYPQTEIHSAIEKHRFSVLVAHRRLGKTVFAINHTIRKAIDNRLLQPRYAYVAPFRNQAKMIAWDYLKRYTAPFPDRRVNESELYIEFWGRRIYILGADNPDAIRGTYLDGAVLDEYAQIKPELRGEIILPALADRDGWIIFLGTPKGQNQFYEVALEAQRAIAEGNPLWWFGMYRADETGVLNEEQLQILRESMTESQWRQEMLCDFTASADDILIPIDLVTDAAQRVWKRGDVEGAPKVIGVDVARFGGDKSVIFRREGLLSYKPSVYSGLDNMTLTGLVAQEIDEFKPDAVFIDSGRGEGVIDRLRQLGYEITEVNFGSQATKNNLYINKRTEMWDGVKQWLVVGGSIVNDPALKSDLVTPTYSFDAQNRMKLESKDDIKKRLGRSPDTADALALTFAYPVQRKSRATIQDRDGLMFTNRDYDPFK